MVERKSKMDRSMVRQFSIMYLAMAIDKANSNDRVEIVNQVYKEAKKYGIRTAIFLPSNAYLLPTADDVASQMAVRVVNEQVLLASSHVLVIYEPGVETWGVSQEVRLADDHNIPVILICGNVDAELPIYLNLSVTERFSSVAKFFESIQGKQEKVAWLKNQS